MMPPADLARFLKEEVPHLWEYHSVNDELRLTGDDAKQWTDAFAASIGLLRYAATKFDEIAEGKGAFSRDRMEHCENTVRNMVELAKAAAATLRLVVGPLDHA